MTGTHVQSRSVPKVDVDLAAIGLSIPTAGPVTVRSAQPRDADEVCRLVNAWADEGLTLRRTRHELALNAGEFVVGERIDHAGRERLVACGALAVFSPALGEIRSVAVDPGCKGTGAGKQIVLFLVDQARVLELDEVVLLTKVPGFFARFGFRTISPGDLPRAFLDEAIAGRGRQIQDRVVMLRELL